MRVQVQITYLLMTGSCIWPFYLQDMTLCTYIVIYASLPMLKLQNTTQLHGHTEILFSGKLICPRGFDHGINLSNVLFYYCRQVYISIHECMSLETHWYNGVSPLISNYCNTLCYTWMPRLIQVNIIYWALLACSILIN